MRDGRSATVTRLKFTHTMSGLGLTAPLAAQTMVLLLLASPGLPAAAQSWSDPPWGSFSTAAKSLPGWRYCEELARPIAQPGWEPRPSRPIRRS